MPESPDYTCHDDNLLQTLGVVDYRFGQLQRRLDASKPDEIKSALLSRVDDLRYLYPPSALNTILEGLEIVVSDDEQNEQKSSTLLSTLELHVAVGIASIKDAISALLNNTKKDVLVHGERYGHEVDKATSPENLHKLYLEILKQIIFHKLPGINLKVSQLTQVDMRRIYDERLEEISSRLLQPQCSAFEASSMLTKVETIESEIRVRTEEKSNLVVEINYMLNQIGSLLQLNPEIAFPEDIHKRCNDISSSMKGEVSVEEHRAILIETIKLLTNCAIRSIENMLKNKPANGELDTIMQAMSNQAITLEQARQALSKAVEIQVALANETEKAKAIENIRQQVYVLVGQMRAFLDLNKTLASIDTFVQRLSAIETSITKAKITVLRAEGILIDAIRLFTVCIIRALEAQRLCGGERDALAELQNQFHPEDQLNPPTIDTAQALLLQVKALCFGPALKEMSGLQKAKERQDKDIGSLISAGRTDAIRHRREKTGTALTACIAGLFVGAAGAAAYRMESYSKAPTASAVISHSSLSPNEAVSPPPAPSGETKQFSGEKSTLPEPLPHTIAAPTTASTSFSATASAVFAKAKTPNDEYNGYAGTVCERAVNECLTAKSIAVKSKTEECARAIQAAYGFDARGICRDIKVGFEDVNVDCAPLDQEPKLKNPSDATCAALIKTQSNPYPYDMRINPDSY